MIEGMHTFKYEGLISIPPEKDEVEIAQRICAAVERLDLGTNFYLQDFTFTKVSEEPQP